MSVEPLTQTALALRVADAATRCSLTAAASEPAYGVRVGIDGAVDADTGPLADLVAGALADIGRPVARVRRADFLRPRSVRLEFGAEHRDARWERWYDDGALRREVLDSLGPDAERPPSWLPALWDVERDRSVRAERQVAMPGTVAVVDGPYLLRWELADAFDLVVHLQVSPAALSRRVESAELEPVRHGWERYLEETDPAARAAYVVRFEDPRHPAVSHNLSAPR